MSPSDTDVVVTGLGATTPLGGDVATTWDALLAGRSGVSRITDDWIKEFPAQGRGGPEAGDDDVGRAHDCSSWNCGRAAG